MSELRDPSAPTEDEIAAGVVIPPRPTGEAAVLAAFREVTGWTDEDVLHYATCTMCDPIGEEPYWCRDSPKERRFRREHEASKTSPGEPVTPQNPLAAALRREGERVVAEAKARVPLHRGAIRNTTSADAIARSREQLGDPTEVRFPPGGIIQGTAGGPYCGVCGAPIDVVAIPGNPGDTATAYGSCPNGCDLA